MWSRTGRRAVGAPGDGLDRRLGALVAVALGLAVAGCAAGGQPSASLAVERGASVAFESIDGPPVGVFQNLVTDLAAEAEARQVAVVSRASRASYRIRGYLAAIVERGRAHISWVWDVYDADKRRVLRIAGEEAGGRHGANAWAAADDQLLRRIARASMDRLVAFLAAPDVTPAEPAPPGLPAVAMADERARTMAARPSEDALALATPRP